jgi:hypothetical protein
VKETAMNSTLVGQRCRVQNAEVRAYHTGVPLYHRTGVIAEQYENEERVVLLVRLDGMTELACLLLTDVEVLGAIDQFTQTGQIDADTVR